MRIGGYRLLATLLVAAFAAWLLVPWTEVYLWAASAQREFQNAMARALRGIQAGDPWALLSLCAATTAYGIVHAVGPGHGKVLLGGAALASGATFRRLAVLTILSSLAQAGTAILLVGALVFGMRMNSRDAAEFTEVWLAPLSAAAIAAIGAILLWRGLRSLKQAYTPTSSCGHSKTCGCGHAHGPSVETVNSLQSTRDAVAVIASIAIRPCTGALFVLVIAARFEAFTAGCLAVLAMGLGTAITNLAVAGGGRLARQMALFEQGAGSVQALRVSATLQILGASLVLGFSLLFLWPHLM